MPLLFKNHPVLSHTQVTQQAATLAVDIVTTARNIFAKGGVLGFYPGVLPYMTADGIRSVRPGLSICPLSSPHLASI